MKATSTRKKIRSLIVDDEPLARERIRQLLEDEPDITVVAECPNGFDALQVLSRRDIDAIFLDVQMPEMDGFEVLDSLRAEDLPAVVFVTAYDTFAVRAFQVHAVDYVLKPIDRTRFAQAVDRMRKEVARRNHENVDTNLLGLINDLRAERRHHDRLVINTGDRFRFVEVADVDYVTTEGNYVKIHVKGDSHLLRSTMHALEQRLDPGRFVRIHRSTLVNVERLKELQPYRKDDAVAILKDGTRLTVSRRYRSQLLASVTIPR
jgi:two-component system LytT family response regulator